MKKLFVLALLAFPALAFSQVRETAHGLPFSPDNHYNLGSASDQRPATVYVGTGLNVTGSDLQHVQVSLTAANLNGMYAAPVALVAAPGAGKSIVVTKAQFVITRTATAFANGGVVIFQYGSTTHGGGTQALDSTLASTVVTGAAGTSLSIRNGAVISDAASTVTQNVGLYISNQTAAFDTGTGTAVADIWYYVL